MYRKPLRPIATARKSILMFIICVLILCRRWRRGLSRGWQNECAKRDGAWYNENANLDRLLVQLACINIKKEGRSFVKRVH